MVLAEDLRQAVLQAALQGKLTEQLETDSNVDDMLICIQEEKEKLIADKKIKREKTLFPIQDEDIPFDIPDSWKWIKIGEIVDIKNGFTPKRTDETLWNPKEIPWFTVEDIHEQGLIIHHTAQAIAKKALGKSNGRIIPPHTVLLCCTSATIGRYAMTEIELTTNQQWNGLVIKREYKRIICSEYILVWVASLKEKMTEIAQSTTFPFLSVDKLASFLMPLPPIEEQQRIVDKINEIMPEIDEYEKIEKELEVLKKGFPTDMKEALLQAAMQGKLTEQLESDSNVDELLTSIKKEKEELIAQKKIKKEKPLSDIEKEEIPFDIPENWRFVQLGEIALYLDAGKSPNCIKENVKKDEWGVITTTAIQANNFLENENKQLPIDFEVNKDIMVKVDDILITRAGPMNRTGIMCLVENVHFNLLLSDKTVRVNINNKNINKKFIVNAVNAPNIRLQIINMMSGMDKQQVNISQEKIRKILIPFPPIEEQQRIVERLDRLLPLCEELKD